MVRKRFGQHFLEPVWADKVVAAIGPQPSDSFLEIGPGPGALTLRLAPRVAHLTAIEIDRDLAAELRPKLPPNVTLEVGDFLEKIGSDPLFTKNVKRGSDPYLRVAGNLPYNISSPILFRLLELQRELRLVDATLMVQREVADRIVAKPGSAEYGVLSILLQLRAAVFRPLTLPPGAFRPPPKVSSALIRLVFCEPGFPIKDPALLERLVRSMFTQRRKTLSNAIADFAAATPVAPAAALAAADIDPTRRPQTLQLVEIARLADVFASA